jgi:hypothetical protein
MVANKLSAPMPSLLKRKLARSASPRFHTPSMRRGYVQMTGIDMITHLKPA